jgi:two-component system CheB/CheR fusion protein
MSRHKSTTHDSQTFVASEPSVPPAGDPAPAGQGTAPHKQPPAFLIAGIGASAGGLDALSKLLHALPPDTGVAFVVIQHLDPSRDSMLPEILARQATIAVSPAEDRTELTPNHVYVIPPGRNVALVGDTLQLSPRSEARGQHRPVDHFLRSLAGQHGHKSIGVVLSGTATDGTLGLAEIKAAGGITFAQDNTAEYSSMPRNAIASGCVDFVLAPDGIAREIARIGSHPYIAPAGASAETMRNEAAIGRILELLHQGTGVDFTHYKRGTLCRRIARRIVLHKIKGLKDYAQFLRDDPGEIAALYEDILVSVTSFFRNPESYEVFRNEILPRLAEHKSRHDQIRVWALGCSTGEDAYSIAMVFREYAEASGCQVPMQIFATDLNGASVEKARAGIYPKTIAQDVSPERLQRFFAEVDGGFRVSKPIRDMCIFARQNVLSDPPFSRIDLIVCRNLLIYLEPVLQQKLISIMHYALRPSGYLWLGSAETIGSYREMFRPENAEHRFYTRKAGPGRASMPVPVDNQRPQRPRPGVPGERNRDAQAIATDPQKDIDRLLLARYAPPGVVINAALDIVQFRGETAPYLAPAAGKASLNLLKMLREGLLVGVRGAVQRAKREDTAVREDGLRVKSDGGYRNVSVVAIPLKGGAAAEDSMIVLFEEHADARAFTERVPDVRRARAKGAATSGQKAGAQGAEAGEDPAFLQQELAATRDYLRSVIEDQEAANEELQSANEEVQSANEELRSINEELEISREEIQSSNEELATVNDELQNRNLELSRSNSDLTNLLGSVSMAIVMLGPDRRIRRFTPAAEKLLNLIPSDVGRPISDIKFRIDIPDLDALLLEVIDTMSFQEREVQDPNGRWFLLRLRPYRTLENKIDGAVLMLIDVDGIKRVEQALRESEARFELLADSAPVLIWVNGPEGCQYVNRAYLDFAGASELEVQRYDWAKFIHPEDKDAYLGAYLEAFARQVFFETQFRMRRADGEYRWMKSAGAPRSTPQGEFLGYVGSTFDITDLKQAESSLVDANRSKNEFLAMLAHELRNPLSSVRNAIQVLNSGIPGDAEYIGQAKSVIARQTENMVRLVDDLLDVSRINSGTIRLRKEQMDLRDVIRNVAEAMPDPQKLTLSLPDEALPMHADAARLEQVFGNLLGNASKFTGSGGHVWLTVERETAQDGPADGGLQQWVRISVRDDGIGMDAKILPRIFDLFVQADSSINRTRGGLGIGLTLAQTLVQLHGGFIEAFSRGPSQGSELVVRLPLDTGRNQPPSAVAQPRQPAMPGRHILIVDDNADAARMLQILLEVDGHEVRVAHDGRSGLQAAAEYSPDVILLDIGLPDMDGFELARKLRSEAEFKDVLLIAVTGYGHEEDVRKGRDAGIDEHMVKPLDPEGLLKLLRRPTAE